ncbi:MAG TPA: CocE/NonD family hydrolase [Ramlibacter sp.]|jgi:dienelactone hydrolase
MANGLRRELIDTALTEAGKPIRLEILYTRPPGPEPRPVVVFNHGSTGDGSQPKLFTQSRYSPAVTKYFNEVGWMVVFPQRRGRGKSDGLYDEGFKPDRSGYSHDPEVALAGLDRALEDVDQVMTWLGTRADVRHDRVVMAGASRGGVLAVAYAGRRPKAVWGAINFSGGWLGRRTATYPEVNRAAFSRGAAFPARTLWLHGSYDRYYPISHCRENFEHFTREGGHGTFHALKGGHGLVEQSALWADLVSGYLKQL